MKLLFQKDFELCSTGCDLCSEALVDFLEQRKLCEKRDILRLRLSIKRGYT